MIKNPVTIKNKDFTTINFKLYFPVKFDWKDDGLLKLMPYILNNESSKYSNEEEFQKEKLKRNIKNFYIGYSKFNDIVFIQFDMTIIDPKYIGEDKIEEAFEFLMDVIYNPKLEEKKFNEFIYEKEYNRLKQNIKSYSKKITTCAYNMALKEADDIGYLKNNVFTDASLLESVTNHKLYNYYKKHIYDNYPFVFVIGDIDKTQINSLVNKYVRKNKMEITPPYNYDKFLVKKDNIVKEIESEDYFHQSVLVSIYKIDDIKEEDKIMMKIVVDLFSSKSSNILKKNLRKDSGLVYTARTNCENHSGIISIVSQINNKTKKKTLDKIDCAFKDIKNKEIITPLLKNLEEKYKINLLRNLDNQNEILFNFIRKNLKYNFTNKDMYEKIKNVTSEDIIKFVKRMKLDVIYFLKGIENEK